MWQSTKCPNLRLTKSEPRDAVHISFIEILGGVHMCSIQANADSLLGGIQMAALGATICNAFNQKEE